MTRKIAWAYLSAALLTLALAGCGGGGSDDRGGPPGADGDGDGAGPGDDGMDMPAPGGDEPTMPGVGPATPGDPKDDPKKDDPMGAEEIEVPDKCKGDDCIEELAGGKKDPFDLDENSNEGVGLDADGAIVIERAAKEGPKFIWIANTPQHTVSKVNTDSFLEEGRYLLNSGVAGAFSGAFGTDPSRSSVNLLGDVFVGSRNGSALTRVSSLGEDCPDTNGDGMITTSTGAADIKAYGQDDCVLWQTQLTGKIRGVAAQDIPAQTVIEPQLDAPPKITEIPAEHYVWVGSNNNGNASDLWKLDAETGDILIHLAANFTASGEGPTPIYGLAMSGDGLLYMTEGYFGNNMAVIDTKQCKDQASCDALVPLTCDLTCTTVACPATCDGAGITFVNFGGATGQAYGITVDCKQRVWLGGYGGGADVRRYDPAAPADMRLSVAAGTGGVHGIGADRDGWVWGSRGGDVVRIHAETLASTSVAGVASKGVGIDSNGRVWSIPQGATATVIEPGPGMMDATVHTTVSGFNTPYTYSDMTGEQLRLATNEPGFYRDTFEGCAEEDGDTYWYDLIYDADVPPDTWIIFRARSADKKNKLGDANWFDVAANPGQPSPVDLAGAADLAGEELKHFIQVEVKLFTSNAVAAGSDGCSETPEITPKVKKFGLSHVCIPEPEEPPPPMCVETGEECEKTSDCCDADMGIECLSGICQLDVPG